MIDLNYSLAPFCPSIVRSPVRSPTYPKGELALYELTMGSSSVDNQPKRNPSNLILSPNDTVKELAGTFESHMASPAPDNLPILSF
jgi:hypothetical protein